MENNVKSLTAIMAVTLLMGAGLVAICNIDDAMASPNLKQTDPISIVNNEIFFISTGKTINLVLTDGYNGFDIEEKPSWLTETSTGLTGKAPSIGVYNVAYLYCDQDVDDVRCTIQLHAVAEGNVNLTTVQYYYDHTYVAIDYIKSGTTYTADTVMVGNQESTKYHTYANGKYQYITPGQTFTFRSTDSSLSLSYFSVKIEELTTLTMPYTAPSGNAIANTNWTYTPTTVSGVTLTVTGASWLSVSGNMIYGVPPAAGTYDIAVKMVKSGYADRTEMFTLTVVSELVLMNSPSIGVITISK